MDRKLTAFCLALATSAGLLASAGEGGTGGKRSDRSKLPLLTKKSRPKRSLLYRTIHMKPGGNFRFGYLSLDEALKRCLKRKGGPSGKSARKAVLSADTGRMHPAYRHGVALYPVQPKDERYMTGSFINYYNVQLPWQSLQQMFRLYPERYTSPQALVFPMHHRVSWCDFNRTLFHAMFLKLGNKPHVFMLKFACSLPRNGFSLLLGGVEDPNVQLIHDQQTGEYMCLLKALHDTITVTLRALVPKHRQVSPSTGHVTLKFVR